jgi:cullin-associated NEDD8-dissociated protein 1
VRVSSVRDACVRSIVVMMYRYMGLSDLMKEIKQDPQSFLGDETLEHKVLAKVLELVQDKISEVKNQAVKWQASVLKRVEVDMISDIFLQSRADDQNHSRDADEICCG